MAAGALEDSVLAGALVEAPGAETVMVTPAPAQNFSRAPGREAISASLQAFSAHGVTTGVRVAEALQTQAKSVGEHPVSGTAETKQLSLTTLVRKQM